MGSAPKMPPSEDARATAERLWREQFEAYDELQDDEIEALKAERRKQRSEVKFTGGEDRAKTREPSSRPQPVNDRAAVVHKKRTIRRASQVPIVPPDNATEAGGGDKAQ